MSYLDRLLRYQVAFGVVGVVVAVAGFFQARELAFTAPRGSQLGWGSYELQLMTYNRLGALVGLALAVIGLLAGLFRRPALGWFAAGGYFLVVVQGLVQTRPEGENLLGSAGQTIAFSLAMALGFATTAYLARSIPTTDVNDPGITEPTNKGSAR